MARERQAGGELTAAAEALEGELRRYDTLAESLAHESLESEKSLRRAAQGLGALHDSEERLRAALTALVEAIGAARERQQAHAETVAQRAEQIKQRTEVLSALLGRWTVLGAEASEVAELAQRTSGGARTAGTNGPAANPGTIDEVDQRLTRLAEQAQALADAARAESFGDLVKQAEGMRQQVLASQNKLRLARGRDG